jgi:hypothetical protein
VGADLLGLALVVFGLATVAPVAQERGRLLPVEADLGGEGQDVRGVQALRPCPKWARNTAVRRNKVPGQPCSKSTTGAPGPRPLRSYAGRNPSTVLSWRLSSTVLMSLPFLSTLALSV